MIGKLLRISAGTAVAVLVAVGLGAELFLPDDIFATRFMDDAGYYFTIARNAGAGLGMTFDGVHATNGVHPLWFTLLVPLFRLVPGEIAALRAVAVLEVALVVGAAALLFGGLRPRLGTAGAFAAAVALAALPRSDEILRRGMESALLLFLLVLAWRRTRRADETGALVDWLVAGMVWAMAFLTRLEAILGPAVILSLRLRRLRTGDKSERAALAVAVPPLLAAAIYATVNQFKFGAWLPVSGLVKSHGGAARTLGAHLHGWINLPWVWHNVVSDALACGPYVTRCRPAVVVGYLLVEVLLVVLAWRYRHAVLAAIRRSGATALLGICVLLTATDLLVVEWMAVWKEVPIVLGTALLLGIAARRWPRSALPLAALATGFALARPLAMATGDNTPLAGNSVFRIQAGRWLRDHLPEGQKVGSWNAGMLGYVSRRPVVGLDGLVNDVTFYRRVVLGGDLAGYLDDEKIRWLSDQGCGADPRPGPFLATGNAQHTDAAWRVVTTFERPYGDGCRGYAVWQR